MKTEILTQEQLRKLIQEKKQYKLVDKIHYFHSSDLDSWCCPEHYLEHLKFVVCYNKKDIIGICKFAFYDLQNEYAISYISTHSNYKNKGVVKSSFF
jgi:hypothetical protein